MQKQYKYEDGTELTVKMTPQQFITLRNAIGQGISLTEIKELPEKRVYVSTETGEVVEPNEEQIEKGEVVQTMDLEGTFHPDNIKISFDASKITMDMLNANLFIETLFKQHIEEGLVKEVEDEQ